MTSNDVFKEPMTIRGLKDTAQGKYLHLYGDFHGNLYVDPNSDNANRFMKWHSASKVEDLFGKRVVAVCNHQSRLLYYTEETKEQATSPDARHAPMTTIARPKFITSNNIPLPKNLVVFAPEEVLPVCEALLRAADNNDIRAMMLSLYVSLEALRTHVGWDRGAMQLVLCTMIDQVCDKASKDEDERKREW